MAAGEKKTFADRKTLARIIDKAVAAKQVCRTAFAAIVAAILGIRDPFRPSA